MCQFKIETSYYEVFGQTGMSCARSVGLGCIERVLKREAQSEPRSCFSMQADRTLTLTRSIQMPTTRSFQNLTTAWTCGVTESAS